jgi:hypothetical protein
MAITPLIRDAITAPFTALHRYLEDWPLAHRLRGHYVTAGYINGEQSGPLRMWSYYCHTCEIGWE